MIEELLKQLPTMDEPALRQWQALHKRHVLGETLTDEERARYQAGCDELDSTEKIDGDIPRLLALRARLQEAREISRKQQERAAAADAEIAALEAQLDPRSRELLGIEK